MNTHLFRIGAALALCASTQAQAAASKTCLSNGEVEGLVGYVLPSVLDKVAGSCAAHVSRKGYMATRLPDLIDTIAAGRDAAWPQARAAFMKFGGANDKEAAAAFAALSDDALRQIVDETFAEKLGMKVPPSACLDVEEVLETLEPLPAGNAVRLVTAVMMMAGRSDKSIPACPR